MGGGGVESKWALHSDCTTALCFLLGGDSCGSCISLVEGMRLREPLRTKERLLVSLVGSVLSGEVFGTYDVLTSFTGDRGGGGGSSCVTD